MLIIRRREGQSILIGGGIEIEIVELGAAKVKIGVRAPREVTVQRKEMKIVREHNLASAALAPAIRDAIAGRILSAQNSSQEVSAPADMNFEARYSGHPAKKENPGPARRRDVSLTGR